MTKGFWKTLWEQEKPSRARADRKYLVADAKEHLDRWADYGYPSDLNEAIEILRGTK